jgi:hypothetical protein
MIDVETGRSQSARLQSWSIESHRSLSDGGGIGMVHIDEAERRV